MGRKMKNYKWLHIKIASEDRVTLNIEKQDWKVDGEINLRQGQQRAMPLKSVNPTYFWKKLISARQTDRTKEDM